MWACCNSCTSDLLFFLSQRFLAVCFTNDKKLTKLTNVCFASYIFPIWRQSFSLTACPLIEASVIFWSLSSDETAVFLKVIALLRKDRERTPVLPRKIALPHRKSQHYWFFFFLNNSVHLSRSTFFHAHHVHLMSLNNCEFDLCLVSLKSFRLVGIMMTSFRKLCGLSRMFYSSHVTWARCVMWRAS